MRNQELKVDRGELEEHLTNTYSDDLRHISLQVLSEFFDFILFADDTNLLCAGDDLQTLKTNININLGILFDWFCANKLSLNLKRPIKSCFIIGQNPFPLIARYI